MREDSIVGISCAVKVRIDRKSQQGKMLLLEGPGSVLFSCKHKPVPYTARSDCLSWTSLIMFVFLIVSVQCALIKKFNSFIDAV